MENNLQNILVFACELPLFRFNSFNLAFDSLVYAPDLYFSWTILGWTHQINTMIISHALFLLRFTR